MKKGKLGLLSILFVFLLALVACSSNEQADTKAGVDSEDSKESVQTIKVGTMGTYHPFSYEGEDGKLTGYDLEVLRMIEEVDPSLKFEFIGGPWDSLFIGLDSDKFQLLANQITSNPDRVERYTLSGNTYFTCVSSIIVKKGTTGINSLEDLQGKTIGLTVGDSFTRVVEDWNAQNGNILTIKYYEQDVTTILQDLANGRIDATVNDPIMAQEKAKVQNLDVEVVGEPIAKDPTYFIAKKDEAGKELMAKIDAALEQLIADGKLSELSLEYFGVDYTK